MSDLRPPLSTLPEPEPGLPVVASVRHGEGAVRGVLLGECALIADGCIYDLSADEIRVDLISPQGWIAHQWLLRWLADRLIPGSRFAYTGHSWGGLHDSRDPSAGPWWVLSGHNDSARVAAKPWSSPWRAVAAVVPALAAIDHYDDTRLSWGGRRVDSAALVAVCQHLMRAGAGVDP